MVDAAHMKNVNSLLGQIRDYQTQAQQGVSLKPDAVSELPVTLPVTAPTKLGAVTELVTLAIPAMVIVEPPPTGLILLTFSILISF